MSLYSRSKSTASRLLSKYGMEYAILRKGNISMVEGKEVVTPDTKFKAVGIKTEYSPYEINGTSIQVGDVKMVFSSEADIKINDLVIIDGEKHLIKNPNPVKPADVLICYKAQLRKA